MAGSMVVLSVIVTGCTHSATRHDVCTEWDDFTRSAEQVRDSEIVDDSVERLRRLVEDVEADLDHLRATSEHRYDASIAVLQNTLDELSHIVAGAGAEARRAVQPLIEDSIRSVRDAVARLDERVSATCVDE